MHGGGCEGDSFKKRVLLAEFRTVTALGKGQLRSRKLLRDYHIAFLRLLVAMASKHNQCSTKK
jgi:hypothetical protein